MDAADSSTITLSSTAITQWNDKSSAGNNFVQATTANSPTVGTSANGLPTVYFASANQQLVSSQNNATTGNASRTVIQVFWCPTLSSAYYSVTGTESGANPAQAWGHAKNANSDVTYPFMYSSAGNDVYTFVYSTPNPLITYAQYDSTASSLTAYYATSGATGGTTTVGNFTTKSCTFNTTAGVWYLGRRQQAATGSVTSHLLEMIHFNKALSTTERQQVEGYLTQKWDLNSLLPSSHPGRSTTLYRSDYKKQNVMTALPYYAAFTPRQISGCALWLDGADPAGNGVVPSQGSQIGSWIDKSGNGRTMSVQGTAANITYSRVNGINAVWFNNPSVNNAYMRNMSFQVLTTASVFMVFVPLSFSATWSFLWSWNPTASQYLLPGARIQQNNNNLQLYLTWYGSGNYGTVTNGTTYLSYFDWTNTTSMPINWSLNGTVPPTSSTVGSMINNTSVTEFDLGADLGGTYGNMYLSEMIIYNSILSSTQRQQVESYLAQKWGLTASLPGGHSHATQPAGAVTKTTLANLKLVVQPRRYTSFRWTITAGTTDSLIQFSEFQVGFNGTQLVFASPTTATTGSTISWNTGAGEGPAQAVDNNLNTKGLGIGTSGLVLIVTVATPIAANMYRWATANDVTPGRNPTQWTVDGSADGLTYVRLHTQNTAYSTPSSTFTYTSWIPFTYS